jgi:isopentenyl phosphate kinase
VAIFWVVKNDYRAISTSEKRNVVYPAKAAGLMEDAPTNERGIQTNLEGETSRCGFVLTTLGMEYFKKIIEPLLDKDYVSAMPIMPRRMVSHEATLEDLKELVKA